MDFVAHVDLEMPLNHQKPLEHGPIALAPFTTTPAGSDAELLLPHDFSQR